MARYLEAVPAVEPEREAWALPGGLRSLLLFCRRKPLGALGGFLVLVMLVMAIGAPWIAHYAYDDSIPGSRMRAPDSQFWMGTDNLSRDMWSRVVYGARVSVTVGFITIALAILFATAVGVSSAYLGGTYDIAVQRVVDAWMSFPYLVIILSIMSVLGPGLLNLILSLSVLVAAQFARVIRGATLSVMQNPYIESALAESSLSFLGLGVPPPQPSWGAMLAGSGRSYMQRAPWMAIFPGAAISLAVFGFNMLGDALRDVLDPRLRGTGIGPAR